MDLARIQEAVRQHLPSKCEPLLLTFGRPVVASGGGAIIGADAGADVYVDASSGRVESVDAIGELPTRFLNSSIEQLGRCIAAYSAYADRLRGAENEDDARQMVHELVQSLTEIDREVLTDPENWWSVIVEQAGDWLL